MYDFQATAITGHCHILKDFLGVGAVRIDVCLFNAFIADLTIVLSHLFDESLASLRLVLDHGDSFLAVGTHTHIFVVLPPLINAVEAKLMSAANLALLLLVNEFQADRASLLLHLRVHLPRALHILVHRASH
jgi:hypothetical protein